MDIIKLHRLKIGPASTRSKRIITRLKYTPGAVLLYIPDCKVCHRLIFGLYGAKHDRFTTSSIWCCRCNLSRNAKIGTYKRLQAKKHKTTCFNFWRVLWPCFCGYPVQVATPGPYQAGQLHCTRWSDTPEKTPVKFCKIYNLVVHWTMDYLTEFGKMSKCTNRQKVSKCPTWRS